MIEIKGKYNEAKIFTDVVDSASIAQVQELCNQEFTAGSRIRLMPDIHAGAGCTIGTTMTITDKVVPNLVGVDIGCGMETTRIREGRLELQKLDKLIYEKIPSGFSIRDKAHRYLNEIDLSELCCARHVDLLRAEKSIGTLGGGNHFIEVDKDDEGNLYIVVHSGSRHLGVEVASYYQEAGYKVLNRTDDASIEALIARMKAEGREKEIQKELKKLKNLKQTNIPKALAYVSGELFEQYIHDMKIVQHFAMLNRQAMMDEIVKGMKLHVEEQFTTIHNYIDTDAMILRKGAVSAKEGERLLIPINMRDGSLLCVGKGNEDWNCSAPHGAGRLMSRADAKQSFTVSSDIGSSQVSKLLSAFITEFQGYERLLVLAELFLGIFQIFAGQADISLFILELQDGCLADRINGLLRIFLARKFNDDTVAAFTLDDWFSQTHFIDTLLHDVDDLGNGLRRNLVLICIFCLHDNMGPALKVKALTDMSGKPSDGTCKYADNRKNDYEKSKQSALPHGAFTFLFQNFNLFS